MKKSWVAGSGGPGAGVAGCEVRLEGEAGMKSSVRFTKRSTSTAGILVGTILGLILFAHQVSAQGSPFLDSGDNQRMNINFFDMDVRDALWALALKHELNVVMAPDVSGKITVHLFGVTLEEALDALASAAKLSYGKHGRTYTFYKPKETADPEANRLNLRVFRLKYAKVDKVQEVLDALPGIRLIKIHEPSSTIVVQDTPENIEKIEKIIAYWDRMPRQVMIEAKILEIRLTDEMSLGVNWEKILGDARIAAGGFSTAVIPTTAPTSPVPAEGEGVFGNIITGAGSRRQFTAALDALHQKTKVNILSTPKILAIHGEKARVQVGGQQGYRVTTTNLGVVQESIQFIDTGTILEITPYIDDKNHILLRVMPNIQSAVIEQGIPVVRSTVVSTWLLAKNGETVFIGGLIQDSVNRTSNRIPCLGAIPYLGALFGRTNEGKGKTELVVLITPEIQDFQRRPGNEEAIEKTTNLDRDLKKAPKAPSEQFVDFLNDDPSSGRENLPR